MQIPRGGDFRPSGDARSANGLPGRQWLGDRCGGHFPAFAVDGQARPYCGSAGGILRGGSGAAGVGVAARINSSQSVMCVRSPWRLMAHRRGRRRRERGRRSLVTSVRPAAGEGVAWRIGDISGCRFLRRKCLGPGRWTQRPLSRRRIRVIDRPKPRGRRSSLLRPRPARDPR